MSQLETDLLPIEPERGSKMFEMRRYVRRPFYVDAVQVTDENIEAVANWCEGELRTMKRPGSTTKERYIKVNVHLPITERQTKAFVGDWVLKAVTGFKVYTPKAFEKSFQEAPDLRGNEEVSA